MSIVAITMPKWGMTMTEGKIAAWLKAEGDAVAKGEEFVEVETDKIANGVEAEASGVLRRIVVPEGRSAPCGGLIAVMAGSEVPEAEIDAFLEGFEIGEDGEAESHLSSDKIEVGGVALNVVTARPEGVARGAPILMVHGFGADAQVWMFNHEALCEGRAVHAVDLPSHGGSDVRPEIADWAAMADLVAGVAERVADGPLHLVGHSLGGRIALALAVRLDARSLTLIAPAGLSVVDHGFVEAFVGADRRRPMKAALAMLVADESAIGAEMVERTLAYKRVDGVGEALRRVADANLLNHGAGRGVAEDLAALACPCLVIWGAEDAVIPASGASMAGPHARIAILPGAGHMPQMERAAEVNALIAAHVGGAE